MRREPDPADRFCSNCGAELVGSPRRLPTRRSLWPWLVVVLVALTGLPAVLALLSGVSVAELQGQVVDALTGAPVGGATVRVGGRWAVSDAEWFFILKGVGRGRLAVRVSAPGCETLRASVTASRDVVLPLLPEAVWWKEYPIPRGDEHTVDTGRGLTVTVAAAGQARKLTVREHPAGLQPAVGMVAIRQVFGLELFGSPAPGKRQATLTFHLPPEVDPAHAVILRLTEEGWCLAVSGDAPGDLAALGGVLAADGRAITVELDSLSTYALATFRRELRAFPISTRVVSQDFDAGGNLVVEVLLEQPRQLLGFVGAWWGRQPRIAGRPRARGGTCRRGGRGRRRPPHRGARAGRDGLGLGR